MSSLTPSLSRFDRLRDIARHVDPRPVLRHTRKAAAAAVQETWTLIKTAATLRDEVRRMADECEASRPEQAAHLRKLAASSWAE